MKGKRRIPPILVSALLTAGMLFCNGTSVQAELNFGELGSENNQIAAPAAGITASPEAVAWMTWEFPLHLAAISL